MRRNADSVCAIWLRLVKYTAPVGPCEGCRWCSSVLDVSRERVEVTPADSSAAVGQALLWRGHLRRTEGRRRWVPQVHAGVEVPPVSRGGVVWVGGVTVVVALSVAVCRRWGGVFLRWVW